MKYITEQTPLCVAALRTVVEAEYARMPPEELELLTSQPKKEDKEQEPQKRRRKRRRRRKEEGKQEAPVGSSPASPSASHTLPLQTKHFGESGIQTHCEQLQSGKATFKKEEYILALEC